MIIKCSKCGKESEVDRLVEYYKCDCGNVTYIPVRPVLYTVYMDNYLIGLFKSKAKAIDLCGRNNLNPDYHIGEVISDL